MPSPDLAEAIVVIPAHNEARHLSRCLRAVITAAACLPIPVHIVVVLDACDDGSEHLAGQFGPDVHFVSVDARSVGAARAAGFSYARSLDADCAGDKASGDLARTWYATTDADSCVDPDWLLRQLADDADVVLGVVRVSDWRNYPKDAIRRYLRAYQRKTRPDRSSHDHIHGANMGFRADAYWRVGGFRALASGEDVELVERFEIACYRIHRDAKLSVTTSARGQGRAPRGFAEHLRRTSRSARRPVAAQPALKDLA